MPHLSLLYGVYPSALKDQIIAALNSALRLHFKVTSIHLIRALSDDPKNWSRTHEMRLTGPAPTRMTPCEEDGKAGEQRPSGSFYR